VLIPILTSSFFLIFVIRGPHDGWPPFLFVKTRLVHEKSLDPGNLRRVDRLRMMQFIASLLRRVGGRPCLGFHCVRRSCGRKKQNLGSRSRRGVDVSLLTRGPL